MSDAVTLSPESVRAVAEQICELLAGAPLSAELIDASEVARRFNVSRDYVYEHQAELGGVKLGKGPKARLRFDPERVLEALAPQPFSTPSPQPAHSRRRRRQAQTDLLPIGGQQ